MEFTEVVDVWVCLICIIMCIMVNFFVKQWLVNFVIVFLCIYMITTNTNEWLAWVAALVLAVNAVQGISRLVKGV